MNLEIAIFRRGGADRTYWPIWMEKARLGHIVDLPERVGLEVDALGDNCWLASCSGMPLTSFDALIFLGMPGAFALPYPTNREQLYIHLEWESALLAAMAALPDGRVLNPGFVFAWNRSLFDPVHMLRDLAKLGWITPSVRRQFDFVSGIVHKHRQPEPNEAEKRLLVITKQDIMFGDRPEERVPDCFMVPASATQQYLEAWRLDWVTLAVASIAGQAVAFGLQPDLPECLPADVATSLISRALLTSIAPTSRS